MSFTAWFVENAKPVVEAAVRLSDAERKLKNELWRRLAPNVRIDDTDWTTPDSPKAP